MKHDNIPASGLSRRSFMRSTAQAAIGATAALSLGSNTPTQAADAPPASEAGGTLLPSGTIGKVKISRMLLGGNLISGYMHARDLKYVGSLFRAYVTEKKLMETFQLAEQSGINTVFETGADYVKTYNKTFGRKMQFIPHIEVKADQSESDLKDHIQRQVDTGGVALYVWGVSGDKMVQDGAVGKLGRAVELAKQTGLPVGVGGHSLLVPMACEKEKVPCDFYVKTFHTDQYPSATPKPQRKEFMWADGAEGWYDNMWCMNPEETIAFMKTVTKPWIAFKVLAAGAIYPKDGFSYAFKNGADFIAVGMLDFQVKENCDVAARILRQTQKRDRPWCA